MSVNEMKFVGENNSETSNLLCQTSGTNCGKFGTEEIIDVAFLGFYAVIGTLGNLMVIFSLLVERKIHKQANVFVVNLAAADLFICAVTMPLTISNIVNGDLSISQTYCGAIGYVSNVTWVCSIYTLCLIILNRCWGVLKHDSRRVFIKNFNIVLVILLWMWSVLITSPILIGWTHLRFSYAINFCSWNEQAAVDFNIYYVVFAIILPTLFIFLCYCTLFLKLKISTQSQPEESNPSLDSSNKNLLGSRLKYNQIMLKVMGVVVVAFLISWIPFWVITLFFSQDVSTEVEKIFMRLGMSNSVMNFVIYGFLSPSYRSGYKSLLYKLSCCKKRCQCLLSNETDSEISSHRASKSFMFHNM